MSAGKKLVREKFRTETFARDGHRCVMCGRPEKLVKLDAHHIHDRNEMPNGGYVKENAITLCDAPQPDGDASCHMKAERFHISGGRECVPGFHPDDLYRRVGSNFARALQAAQRLK